MAIILMYTVLHLSISNKLFFPYEFLKLPNVMNKDVSKAVAFCTIFLLSMKHEGQSITLVYQKLRKKKNVGVLYS